MIGRAQIFKQQPKLMFTGQVKFPPAPPPNSKRLHPNAVTFGGCGRDRGDWLSHEGFSFFCPFARTLSRCAPDVWLLTTRLQPRTPAVHPGYSWLSECLEMASVSRQAEKSLADSAKSFDEQVQELLEKRKVELETQRGDL